MRHRTLTLLATPAVLGAMTVAVPALAGVNLIPTAHTSATKCFTARIAKHKVRECLVVGPRGLPGPAGPRGFTGATGKTGKTGATGKNGAAGKNGTNGTNGTNGAAGVQGSPGTPGTARAFAVVNPTEVEPTASSKGLVTAQTSNFASIHRVSTGTYCLATAVSINPASEPAIVTGESSYSTGGAVAIAVLNAQHNDCAAGEFEVITYDARSPSSPSSSVGFAIAAP
ncbi:MAG TPA: hypothetical protein VIJ33_03610 [Solirubrobacteraceae bacterium]